MWCGETGIQDTVPGPLEDSRPQGTPRLQVPVKTILQDKEVASKEMTYLKKNKKNFVEKRYCKIRMNRRIIEPCVYEP